MKRTRLGDGLNSIFVIKKDVWRTTPTKKFSNMVKEMMLKASLYNLFLVEK
jgi:hypothetical protein